jgi:hypothetical protein
MATEKKPAAAKKSAPKKAATTKAPAKKSAEKKSVPKKASTNKSVTVSAFERYKMIEVAAYYLAEQKGFTGNSADDWVTAEKQIDKKIAKK